MEGTSQRAPRALLLIAVLIIGFLAFTSIFGDRGLISIRGLNAEESRLHARAEGLESDNLKLREDVRRLREDDVYLERVARESQGLVKEGETVYRFPAAKPAPTTASPAPSTISATPPAH
jgi:cell division protein FtsB